MSQAVYLKWIGTWWWQLDKCQNKYLCNDLDMILTIALEQILKWSISFCGWCVYSATTVWNVVIKLLGMFHSCTHEVIERARDIPKPIIILPARVCICIFLCVYVCACVCVVCVLVCAPVQDVFKGCGGVPCEPPQPAGDTPWSGLLIRRERKNGESVEPPYLVHCF